MNEWQILVASAAIIIGYKFVWYRLRTVVQPIRLEVAEIGETLLASSDLDKRDRALVQFLLDQTFSLKYAIAIVLLFPIAPIFADVDTVKKRQSDLSKERVVEMRDVVRKGMFCIVANSPITFLVFFVEIALFKLILPCGNGLVATLNGAQTLRERLENLTHWRFQH
ncbi:hypothetical protein [Nisaea sp.]|uniref:hypothetical protein n=2 Tax=Alphaproteobacteria TaxID=28211 RepID=UPI003263D597